jgi:hypothetical protein
MITLIYIFLLLHLHISLLLVVSLVDHLHGETADEYKLLKRLYIICVIFCIRKYFPNKIWFCMIVLLCVVSICFVVVVVIIVLVVVVVNVDITFSAF